MQMRSDAEIEKLVQLFPKNWRRFCNPGPMGCACIGCVSVPKPYLDAGIPLDERLTEEEMVRWYALDNSRKSVE